ncbi:MAG: cobalamin biosynthesis protein [Coriobacteriaceae bacterium]|nr:cobalamin biosynthesis protein [Coriobacteriaceae bacterium]
MPRVACIAFTERGCHLAVRIARELGALPDRAGWECSAHGPARFASETGVQPYDGLEAWTAARFADADALVFVGAAGIAVRAIAPHVKDKFADPAVVSVDEAGAFAVPLLSGHVGGANRLARAIAGITGGQAAISTATDVNGLFAVDEWAREQGFSIVERELAKQVSATLLEGGAVGFAADAACGGIATPSGLVDGPAELGVLVSADVGARPFPRTLHLVPRTLTVGVGCRKGTDPAVLERAVDAVLERAGATQYQVEALATIDVKRDEPAIVQLAAKRGWDLRLYAAEELARVPGAFAASAFVERTVGVDNVCERAACAAGGKLVLGKQAGDGVTVAVAAPGQVDPVIPRRGDAE